MPHVERCPAREAAFTTSNVGPAGKGVALQPPSLLSRVEGLTEADGGKASQELPSSQARLFRQPREDATVRHTTNKFERYFANMA